MKNIKISADYLEDAEEIKTRLSQTTLADTFEIADARHDYYQNDEATIVLRLVDGKTPSVSNMVALANLVNDFCPSEISTINENGTNYIRVWWD